MDDSIVFLRALTKTSNRFWLQYLDFLVFYTSFIDFGADIREITLYWSLTTSSFR